MDGYCDNGEWQSSAILKYLMKTYSVSNGILIVTRKCGGVNLGKLHFDLIKKQQWM